MQKTERMFDAKRETGPSPGQLWEREGGKPGIWVFFHPISLYENLEFYTRSLQKIPGIPEFSPREYL